MVTVGTVTQHDRENPFAQNLLFQEKKNEFDKSTSAAVRRKKLFTSIDFRPIDVNNTTEVVRRVMSTNYLRAVCGEHNFFFSRRVQGI